MVTNKTADQSLLYGFAYAIVTAGLVGAYLAGAACTGLKSIGIDTYPEMWVAICIAALGSVAISAFRADLYWILSAGTVGSFIVLTANQEPHVRFLALGAVLFSIGVYGMVMSRNAVRVLMSIELMLNAVNINLVTFANFVDPGELKGQIFAIFILTVAAAEAAVGLGIVLAIYRNMATVDMDRFNLLKW